MLLQDKLNQLHKKNQLIQTTGTLLGAGLGAGLAYNYGHDLEQAHSGALLGGLSGLGLSGFLTTDDSEYKAKILFGPYKDKIIDLVINISVLIDNICEIHRDYSYKTSFIKFNKKFESCNLDFDDEKQIPKLRNCWISFIVNSLEIVKTYAKERRADPDIREYVNHELNPEFQVIQKYLKDSKVILDHVDELINISDFYIEETAKARIRRKAVAKARESGQLVTPQERFDAKPNTVDMSKRRLLKGAAIGAAAATAVPLLKHAADGVKKLSGVKASLHSAGNTIAKAQALSDARKVVGLSAGVKDPVKRSLLTTALTSSDGYKTIKNVGKIGKLGVHAGFHTGEKIGSIFASDEMYDSNLKIIHT